MEEFMKSVGIELKDKYGSDMKRIAFWKKKHCSSAYMKRLKKKTLGELKVVEFGLFDDVEKVIDKVLVDSIEKSLFGMSHISDALSHFTNVERFNIK